MVFRKAHRLRRAPLLAVAHVAVGPVRPGELDHQRELVDAADGGKHGDELVLEVVPRDPVAVDLSAAAGRRTRSARHRPAEDALALLLQDLVAGGVLQVQQAPGEEWWG